MNWEEINQHTSAHLCSSTPTPCALVQKLASNVTAGSTCSHRGMLDRAAACMGNWLLIESLPREVGCRQLHGHSGVAAVGGRGA
jgi:hypothetical protein